MDNYDLTQWIRARISHYSKWAHEWEDEGNIKMAQKVMMIYTKTLEELEEE
jgi:hypothetical protein